MHCEPRGYEIDLRPAQPDKLGDPQPVPEAHQDRQCTAAAVPAALSRRLDQALDLRWRQILRARPLSTFGRRPGGTRWPSRLTRRGTVRKTVAGMGFDPS